MLLKLILIDGFINNNDHSLIMLKYFDKISKQRIFVNTLIINRLSNVNHLSLFIEKINL